IITKRWREQQEIVRRMVTPSGSHVRQDRADTEDRRWGPQSLPEPLRGGAEVNATKGVSRHHLKIIAVPNVVEDYVGHDIPDLQSYVPQLCKKSYHDDYPMLEIHGDFHHSGCAKLPFLSQVPISFSLQDLLS